MYKRQPVGDPDYERAEALRIATKVAADVDRVTLAFKNSPHHLWQATKLSSLSRFDYWLQHITPAATEEPARMVDAALERAVKACLRGTDVAEDPLVKRRLALPIRYMGGGLRKRTQVRFAAYAGSLITAVKQFATRRARDGTSRLGFFPSLAPSLGGGVYTDEGPLLGAYIATGTPAAKALVEAWTTMQEEVVGCSKQGPLSEPITGMAATIKGHLQREITKHIELAAVERLREEMKGLMTEGAWGQIKPGDMRANAFLSCDGLSNQILTSLPNKHYFLSSTDFADAFARYLGCALPSIRLEGLEGKPMPCNSLSGAEGRRGRVCDAHGHEMELAKLPDNSVHAESTVLEKMVHSTLTVSYTHLTLPTKRIV